MITLNRVGDSITGTVNGVRFGVSYDETRFAEMLLLQHEANTAVSTVALVAILEQFQPYTIEDYSDKIASACPDLFVSKATGKFYLTYAGIVSSIALPERLSTRILESVEKGIDASPLVKAWIRFLRNPNFSESKAEKFAAYIMHTHIDKEYAAKLVKDKGVSQEVAYERSTVTQTPITQEGLLCTYKVSKEITEKYVLTEDGTKKKVSRFTKQIDETTGVVTYNEPEFSEDRLFEPAIQGDSFDAFSSHSIDEVEGNFGHVIRVGNIHSLKDWTQVNCSDSHSSVPGLHAGNLDYIRGYQTKGTVTHNVFIDPMHIGAFTNDGSGALRVLSYFVHSTLDKVNRSIYHSSKYAEVTDAQWASWKAEAVAVATADSAAKASDLAELVAL